MALTPLLNEVGRKFAEVISKKFEEPDHLREELSRIDESSAAARFDLLPHVVHILTSKDREGDVQLLKEQSDIEEVVDEVVHAYHGGFNKSIQNYSQILSSTQWSQPPGRAKESSWTTSEQKFCINGSTRKNHFTCHESTRRHLHI